MGNENCDLAQNSLRPCIPNLFHSIFCCVPIGPNSDPSELGDTDLSFMLSRFQCLPLFAEVTLPACVHTPGFTIGPAFDLLCVHIYVSQGSKGNCQNVHPNGQKA